jgi:hypothetical protein
LHDLNNGFHLNAITEGEQESGDNSNEKNIIKKINFKLNK